MDKWNEEAAPNNNIPSSTIRTSKQVANHQHEFSEELSDGGERNEYINKKRRRKS